MIKSESLSDRRRAALQAFFDSKGGRQLTAICKRAGVSPEAVRGFLKGKSQSLNQSTYDRLALSERVPVSVLLGDAHLPEESEDIPSIVAEMPETNVRLAPTPPRLNPSKTIKVPIMGVGKGGRPGAFSLNTGEPIDFADRPPKLEHRMGVYCIYLSGESMAPIHEDGDLLFIDSTRRPFPGRDALIELHPVQPGEAPDALVKRVVSMNSEYIEVKEWQPKERKFRIPMDRIKQLHLVLKNTDMY